MSDKRKNDELLCNNCLKNQDKNGIIRVCLTYKAYSIFLQEIKLMNGIIRRQNLTPKQYKRANRVMCMILVVCYIVYALTEIINAGKNGMDTNTTVRCVVYAAAAVLTIIAYALWKRKKLCMLCMACMFLATYAMLVFGNGVVVMVLMFPALIGFMIYLNSLLVGIGCMGALIIGIIKCIMVYNTGDMVLFNYGILIMSGFVLAIFGSFSTILLLIDFSLEDRAVIEEEAAHRAEVANVVAGIVEKLDVDFKGMVVGLGEINDAMESADNAMNGIAGSSENTSEAVNGQVNMTAHIQESLENTNELAVNAKETTERLKDIIEEGKQLADNLQEQSNTVDHNIEKISGTVEQLVDNVKKVSGITEAILAISSQTNLLALNASIEAARAGEAGRGFAVVADQIRTLAEETKVSTEQITAIIRELTLVTNETQAGIRESVECINEQRKHVDEVHFSFKEVERGIHELQSGVEIMGREVESVLEANKEIVDSITLLSAASEEVSAGTQTCKETIDTAFDNLGKFSEKVDGTFEQLQILKETAGA